MSDAKKRGFSWNDRINHDVHNLRGMECSDCHRAIDKEHNFGKGNENVSTVRDDLDNTMKNCRQCHTEGYMGAPRPKHLSIRPNHLEKLACETCHIPACTWPRAKASMSPPAGWSTIPRSAPRRSANTSPGNPITRRSKKRVTQARRSGRSTRSWRSFFTNQDKDGIYYPLFGRENAKAYAKIKDRLKGKKPISPSCIPRKKSN